MLLQVQPRKGARGWKTLPDLLVSALTIFIFHFARGLMLQSYFPHNMQSLAN